MNELDDASIYHRLPQRQRGDYGSGGEKVKRQISITLTGRYAWMLDEVILFEGSPRRMLESFLDRFAKDNPELELAWKDWNKSEDYAEYMIERQAREEKRLERKRRHGLKLVEDAEGRT